MENCLHSEHIENEFDIAIHKTIADFDFVDFDALFLDQELKLLVQEFITTKYYKRKVSKRIIKIEFTLW